MKKAILAASMDPITRGHLNVIERALRLFDELIVGIGINPDKKYTFTLEQRESLARSVLSKFGNRIKVKSFPGLLSDFAHENGIHTIIRGARNSMDFEFERLLNDINQNFHQGLETVIYISDQNHSHISSSAAKELAKNQAKNLLDYVPMVVKKALERTVCGQYLIGITGEIASGKSYIAKELCREHYSRHSGIHCYDIDIDSIGHEILENATENIYEETRNNLAHTFGRNILRENGMVDVSCLREIIFSDQQHMDTFNATMREPMYLMLRRKLMNLKGIIFVNSALIAEAGISSIVNNDIILVRSNAENRMSRMRGRGYSEDTITKRINAQLSSKDKYTTLQEQSEKDGCGVCLFFDNDTKNDPKAIKRLYDNIIEKIVSCGKGF